MYFTTVRLNGLAVVDLPIVGALPSDPYILKSADGLGPPEVVVSIVDTLNAGGVYQGRRPQGREVVLNVALNPNYKTKETVADLRTTLYGMLTPGHIDNVVIQIMNEGDVLVQTDGYIKKLEIVPFTDDPEVQLTFACPGQYLEALDDLYVDPGHLASPSIVNQGTAPAGFRMECNFVAAVTAWSLTDESGNKMDIKYAFQIGDKLTIDTRPGSRGIWVLRGSVTTNIIYALTPDSKWYMLHGGTNAFTTSTQKFTWGNVFYKPRYWGI